MSTFSLKLFLLSHFRPFSGEYLKLKDNGMYACVVCREELFTSESKYESGCGWPAFFDIADSKKVTLKPDLSHGKLVFARYS